MSPLQVCSLGESPSLGCGWGTPLQDPCWQPLLGGPPGPAGSVCVRRKEHVALLGGPRWPGRWPWPGPYLLWRCGPEPLRGGRHHCEWRELWLEGSRGLWVLWLQAVPGPQPQSVPNRAAFHPPLCTTSRLAWWILLMLSPYRWCPPYICIQPPCWEVSDGGICLPGMWITQLEWPLRVRRLHGRVREKN